MSDESFGQYAKRIRLEKGLGLREAARAMGVSAAYLSQVEQDGASASIRVITAMARVYQQPGEEIHQKAVEGGISPRRGAAPKQTMEELRSLYRMGGTFTADEVTSMIRNALRASGLSEEEIERQLGKLSADLPRIRNGGRDALFAAEIKPRFLSKDAIAQAADGILEKNGLGQGSYLPPTPIELLVDREEGISYIIAPLPSTDGDPVVLGRTRWNGGLREITINKDLADSDKESDVHRFRFTLGHEFFHAIEHLQLPTGRSGHLHRSVPLDVELVERAVRYRRSPAERAVNHWVKKQKARGLDTPEDWREWQANRFASAILMPGWSLTEIFSERFDAEFICVPEGENARQLALEVAGELVSGGKMRCQSIAQAFAVSRQAMAIRLLDLGLVREVTG